MFRNPVCIKEMKLSVRTKKTAVGLFVFNGILAALGLFAYYIMFDISGGTSYSYVNLSSVIYLYAVIAVMEMAMIAFVIPAITAGSIASEREKQTLEILLTTRLTPWQIVTGKLVSSISTLLLYIISSLPILCIVFSIGGVTVWDMVQIMLYVFVLAIYLGSFGILFSTIFKKSIVATVYTYGMLILTSIVFYVIVPIVYAVKEVNADGKTAVDVGHLVVINLLNPLISVLALICNQIVTARVFQGISLNGMSNDFWGNMDPGTWLIISIIAQLFVAFLCLFLATKRLNPIKKVKKSKQA
ncbi:MAG: ABC transporter permease [Lachnospiraceae bacterium]|nr:ABC transporter permease [Lachnospiraceae bacterium]